jgi:hypothetical protein
MRLGQKITGHQATFAFDEHYSWREHEGRGYWRGERWMER